MYGHPDVRQIPPGVVPVDALGDDQLVALGLSPAYVRAMQAQLAAEGYGLGISLKRLAKGIGKVVTTPHRLVFKGVKTVGKGAIAAGRFVAKHPALLAIPAAAVAAPIAAPVVAKVAVGAAKTAGRAVGIGRRKREPVSSISLPAITPRVIEEPKPSISERVISTLKQERPKKRRGLIAKGAEELKRIVSPVVPQVVEEAAQRVSEAAQARLPEAGPFPAPPPVPPGETEKGGVPQWLLPAGIGLVAVMMLSGRKR